MLIVYPPCHRIITFSCCSKLWIKRHYKVYKAEKKTQKRKITVIKLETISETVGLLYMSQLHIPFRINLSCYMKWVSFNYFIVKLNGTPSQTIISRNIERRLCTRISLFFFFFFFFVFFFHGSTSCFRVMTFSGGLFT